MDVCWNIGNALPVSWSAGGDIANEVLTYIAQIRDNIGPAITEVRRVLE